MKHQARKRFGQHFLTDASVLGAISQLIAPLPGDRILEIGPGLGALTRVLLARVPQLTAVEIDRDLTVTLKSRFGAALNIVESDVLKLDLSALPLFAHDESKVRVVGNLPYNISSPLLVHLLSVCHRVLDQHFMLQKEVVDRLVAKPGGRDFGRLSVLMQCFYAMEDVLFVPPEAFEPPPRVNSAVVRMIPLHQPLVRDLSSLETLLGVAFSQRRKMLRGTLIPWLVAQGISDHGLEPTARPEEISVETFSGLAQRLHRPG